MKELLTAKGWIMYYGCNCNGSRREHYKNDRYPNYEITIRPSKQTFRILHKNHVIVGPEWGNNLESKMKANGII